MRTAAEVQHLNAPMVGRHLRGILGILVEETTEEFGNWFETGAIACECIQTAYWDAVSGCGSFPHPWLPGQQCGVEKRKRTLQWTCRQPE